MGDEVDGAGPGILSQGLQKDGEVWRGPVGYFDVGDVAQSGRAGRLAVGHGGPSKMQVPGQLPGAENGFVEVDVETMDEDKCTLLGRIADHLTITNTGPGTALNASIDSLALRVLGGSGAVSHASALPFSLGDLAAGASLTRRILLNVPATVTRFSLTEGGALTNGIGSSLTYSTSQVIIR